MRKWFPAKERSIAVGYFNVGSSVGALSAVIFRHCFSDGVGALADSLGFSPLFATLAIFDLLGAAAIWVLLHNRPNRGLPSGKAATNNALT